METSDKVLSDGLPATAERFAYYQTETLPDGRRVYRAERITFFEHRADGAEFFVTEPTERLTIEGSVWKELLACRKKMLVEMAPNETRRFLQSADGQRLIKRYAYYRRKALELIDRPEYASAAEKIREWHRDTDISALLSL